jgi:uncharacterized protein YjbI with pentapeptide repeats
MMAAAGMRGRWRGRLEVQECWRIESETSYDGLTLAGVDLSDQSAAMAGFVRSRLSDIGMARTRFEAFDLDRVHLDGCDLANAVWTKARLCRVEAKECRLTGIDLGEALVKECRFLACEASLANLRAASFRKCRFVDCNLQGADFQHADLRGTVFEGCNLREAQLSFARLEAADLRGSAIEGLHVGVDALRGAVVDLSQAAYLAGLMGLKVMP